MDASLFTRAHFRLSLWCEARSMPFRLTPDRPLSWVLSFANRSDGRRYHGLSTDYILKHVLDVTRRPYLMRDRRCLRQGLLAYQFLRRAGYDIELHFGIDRTHLAGGDMRAHCWIVRQGRAIFNEPPGDTQPLLVHRRDA